jgi:hypothetical protein
MVACKLVKTKVTQISTLSSATSSIGSTAGERHTSGQPTGNKRMPATRKAVASD